MISLDASRIQREKHPAYVMDDRKILRTKGNQKVEIFFKLSVGQFRKVLK